MNQTILNQLKAQCSAEKLVFVFGNFNILHPGHLRFLKFAAEQGDRLFVGLFKKGANPGAFLDDKEREEALLSVAVVDQVLMLDDVLETIAMLKPQVIVKGKEFEHQANPEQAIAERIGATLMFGSGETASAQHLQQRRLGLPHQAIPHYLSESYLALAYCSRHQITSEMMLSTVQRFKTLNIAVIGDVIVDEYVDCQPVGMSREDPTLVVSPLNQSRFVGAAGVVAAHAQGLGANVDFFSVIGDDDVARFVEADLAERGVQATLLRDESRPTTVKTRYRANNKTLLRVNSYRQHDISAKLSQQLLDAVRQRANEYDLVIFSDFNYGVLPETLVSQISQLMRDHRALLVADSQSSSQVGDLGKFVGMDLVTPTEHEARLTIKNSKDGLIQVSEQLGNRLTASNVFVTLGEDGMLIRVHAQAQGFWDTDELPALNANPVDAAGAGDAMLTASSLALAAGANIWEAALLGALGSAQQVSRVGNVPLHQSELLASFVESVGERN